VTDQKEDEVQAKRNGRLILGIAASARKQGNSATLLTGVLNELREEFPTELVFLADLDIQPCQGCHYCEAESSCRIEDDMSRLYQKLLSADAVLLASPAYMGGLASRMQAFMERTWPLRKGAMAGKVGSYIVTGRRRIGMATGVMEAYFTRLGMTKLPGVLGYAFEPGRIRQDPEAMAQVTRLATDCRNHLKLTAKMGE
jgi:multimeric flavodoxin WrbA